MAKKLSYWERRYLKDKAASINRAEDYLLKEQKRLYSSAGDEIRKEIEKLYQNFADQQNITLAEAKERIKDADFRRIDWKELIRESRSCAERLKGADKLPGDIVAALEKQHQELEAQIALYSRRGRISYLELRQLEIDRKLLDLYDSQQVNMYDFLKSEFDDGYYRSIFTTQQMTGFGKDFIHPNERAVEKAILNRYDKRNYSKSLYAHCSNFSNDLRENLTVGLIRGENLDRMASRIHRRMDVAYSAARTLVRTETAYIFEKAAAEAYQACGIEWYEYLATLDNLTSEVCQELDGKHFKVKDAVPGKNYPPMHPNCRSTTVCWFPGEEEKKAKTTRTARGADGKSYEVPADMTYKQWRNRYAPEEDIREHRIIGNGSLLESAKEARQIQNIISPMSRKVKDALKDVTIQCGSPRGNGYSVSENTIYLDANARKKEIQHEIGHAIEYKLFDEGRVRNLKKQLVRGMTISDVKAVKGVMENGETKEIFVIDSLNFVDTYQGRIYADSRQECVDAYGNIDVDRMHEFISVAYQYYMDYPAVMEKRFSDMYKLVKESVE